VSAGYSYKIITSGNIALAVVVETPGNKRTANLRPNLGGNTGDEIRLSASATYQKDDDKSK
jgi:hypothetical protein